MRARRSVGIALLLGVACAGAPRPRVLGEADAVRKSPAATQARPLAPQAAAYADRLQAEAQHAYRAGDLAGAQILSEQAIAAYHRVVALGRLATAERRREQARAARVRSQTSLAELQAEQQRITAQADDLELRARVIREAVPLARNRPASPEREQARREAARALGTQARLLCVATRLLDAKSSAVATSLKALDELEPKLGASSGSAPIDEALRLRSACLHALTLARRESKAAMRATGAADALLAELSRNEGLFPYRDDRGVVVTLRGLFAADGTLSPRARQELGRLGEAAQAHPEFPVLVVLHAARGSAGAADERRGRQVAQALSRGAEVRVETQATGSTEPLVDPKQPGAAERNERVEIVFVAPSS